MKSIQQKLNILTIVTTVIYIIGNFETILIYSYDSPSRTPNSLWLKYKYALRNIYGRKKGIDIFYDINSMSWWFVENHKNVIFFIIISIVMLISIIIGKKEKKLSKVLLVYYAVCFLVMIFVAFLASPRFADYYF